MKTKDLDQNSRENERKGCFSAIPMRFVFVFMGFFGFNLVYGFKVVLSVAIVAMVKSSGTTSDKSQECVIVGPTNSTMGPPTGDFSWNADQKASLLGAFFYGYILTQLPGGLLAERFGAKWIFGASVLITALLSLISPVAANLHYSAFFAVRVGQGLAEGVVFPVMNSMLAKWLPKMERSLGGTIVFTGAQIGTVITEPLAGVLCNGTFLGGWPAIFYLLGIAGCLWFILWALIVSESPEVHPYISAKELQFIKTGQGAEAIKAKRAPTPWKKIVTSLPMWALIITHFGQNWGFLTVLTLLPSYFEKILNIDIEHNGLYSSLPWLTCALMSWIVSTISDRVRASGKVPITYIRKFCNCVGFFGPALCLVGVVFAKCDQTWNIALFILAMGLNGFIFAGFMSTHVDMAPEYAGTLMGITNSLGNLPGFLAPIVANAFTKYNQTLQGWSYVFYLTSAVYIGTGLVYLFFASAQNQQWVQNTTDSDDESHSDIDHKQQSIDIHPNGNRDNNAFVND
ncbi:unnamed protein product [Medioppia subpectinata]|uniref:Sialin n=1 Tax=Medioppia subpectinata TaxID=1979941 RepID=A0A7R9Q6N3_9ACAR|nr:unnamed protein product [Medioppia subpectinata]CAG2114630.1 unnamed protein product [Medioppia subpectinata]